MQALCLPRFVKHNYQNSSDTTYLYKRSDCIGNGNHIRIGNPYTLNLGFFPQDLRSKQYIMKIDRKSLFQQCYPISQTFSLLYLGR